MTARALTWRPEDRVKLPRRRRPVTTTGSRIPQQAPVPTEPGDKQGSRGAPPGLAGAGRRRPSMRGRVESPGPPLVPCRPSPGRHVLYSAAPGPQHHRSDRQAGGAKASTFPGQNAVNVRSCEVSPGGTGHTHLHGWSRAQARALPGAAPGARLGTRSMSMQVSREVQTRRPASLVMTISWVVIVRPPYSRVVTPVTRPSVAARWWVALISTPTVIRSGPACRAEASEPRVSAMKKVAFHETETSKLVFTCTGY